MTYYGRHAFDESDDKRLKELVLKYGEGQWSKVADLMQTFSARQCRERYQIYLKKECKNDPWSLEEDQLLIELHSKMGSRWSSIAEHFDGRHSNAVKNRWYRHLKMKPGRRGKGRKKSVHKKSVKRNTVVKTSPISQGVKIELRPPPAAAKFPAIESDFMASVFAPSTPDDPFLLLDPFNF